MTRTVLYVENGIHGGGSAESLYQLLSVLDRDRFRPMVAFGSRTPYVERIAALDVPTFVLNSWYLSRPESRIARAMSRGASGAVIYGARYLAGAALTLDRLFTSSLRQSLGALITRHDVDLVHTNNNVHRDLWAIETAARTRARCVAHLRSFHALGFSPPRVASATRLVAAFVGYSRSMVEFWAGYGLPPERMHVIHNAIGSIAAEPLNLAREFGIAAGSPVIGIVGRIIPERGHGFLLQALPAVIARHPGLRLLIVGDGDPEDIKRLSTRINQAGLAEHVIFTGHRTDAHAIIAALHAIVLPYTIEPFGRTVLEAWQLGTPVVLSRVGHVGDIVQHDRDALLFDPGDPSALSAQLDRVLSDAALRDRLVRAGRDVCRARFSIEAHADAVERLYARVLVP